MGGGSSSPLELPLRRPSKIQEKGIHHRLVEDSETDGIPDTRQAHPLLPTGNDGRAPQPQHPRHLGLAETTLLPALSQAVVDLLRA